jgi:hypothetical protein
MIRWIFLEMTKNLLNKIKAYTLVRLLFKELEKYILIVFLLFKVKVNKKPLGLGNGLWKGYLFKTISSESFF